MDMLTMLIKANRCHLINNKASECDSYLDTQFNHFSDSQEVA